jgi:hypothetical protein
MDICVHTMSAAILVLAALAAGPAGAADGPPFASRADAEAYIARVLPQATAANPKYKEPNSDIETRWLTKSVAFRSDHAGGVIVVMHEDILKYRGDKIVGRGTHGVEIPLEQTGVGLISDAWVPVDKIEAAAGILFRCAKEPCLRSTHDGKPSIDAQTDITISDKDALAKLYAAFRALLRAPG